MDLVVFPSTLAGSVTPPASKSFAHRALIVGALALRQRAGRSSGAFALALDPREVSDDIAATRDALEVLLAAAPGERVTVNCRESGSTLRFLIPVAAALGVLATFTGEGRLPARPVRAYRETLLPKGVVLKSGETCTLPLTVEGRLAPRSYRVEGSVSSQYVSGLLMALSLFERASAVFLTSPLSSAPYVQMTCDVLSCFGKTVTAIEATQGAPYGGFALESGTLRIPDGFSLEKDWSQAAFWEVARMMGAPVDIVGMNAGSSQGDRAVLAFLARMKAAQPGEVVTMDLAHTPDLFPALAVAALSLTPGITCAFKSIARLATKESDRVEATLSLVRSLGGVATLSDADTATIEGAGAIRGGDVLCAGDHRIAMSAAIAGVFAQKPVTLWGAQCVSKSYPAFFEELARLGARVEPVRGHEAEAQAQVERR